MGSSGGDLFPVSVPQASCGSRKGPDTEETGSEKEVANRASEIKASR